MEKKKKKQVRDPYTYQSECIYWRTAVFNLVENDWSHYDVFALSYLSFEPAQACFYHPQVAKESPSKLQVWSFVIFRLNAINFEHLPE